MVNALDCYQKDAGSIPDSGIVGIFSKEIVHCTTSLSPSKFHKLHTNHFGIFSVHFNAQEGEGGKSRYYCNTTILSAH